MPIKIITIIIYFFSNSISLKLYNQYLLLIDFLIMDIINFRQKILTMILCKTITQLKYYKINNNKIN